MTTFTATASGVVGADSVTLNWSPDVDEWGGERDIMRYIVWRRNVGAANWGSPFVTVPNGQATYTIVDLSVPDATSVEYAISARDCTPASAHRLSPIRLRRHEQTAGWFPRNRDFHDPTPSSLAAWATRRHAMAVADCARCGCHRCGRSGDHRERHTHCQERRRSDALYQAADRESPRRGTGSTLTRASSRSVPPTAARLCGENNAQVTDALGNPIPGA